MKTTTSPALSPIHSVLLGMATVAKCVPPVCAYTVNCISIADVERANDRAGRRWFDPGALRFFRSRVAQSAYQASNSRLAFFTSSEQNPGGLSGTRYPRLYSVRVADLDTGCITTVGAFQGYETGAQANSAAKRAAYLDGHRMAGHGTPPTVRGSDVDLFAAIQAAV